MRYWKVRVLHGQFDSIETCDEPELEPELISSLDEVHCVDGLVSGEFHFSLLSDARRLAGEVIDMGVLKLDKHISCKVKSERFSELVKSHMCQKYGGTIRYLERKTELCGNGYEYATLYTDDDFDLMLFLKILPSGTILEEVRF